MKHNLLEKAIFPTSFPLATIDISHNMITETNILTLETPQFIFAQHNRISINTPSFQLPAFVQVIRLDNNNITGELKWSPVPFLEFATLVNNSMRGSPAEPGQGRSSDSAFVFSNTEFETIPSQNATCRRIVPRIGRIGIVVIVDSDYAGYR
ncbi:MAG: hypothetical protein MI748_04555 [Opitutales bacterium]|nr:hypothetical protein [Opitutales bacterium]